MPTMMAQVARWAYFNERRWHYSAFLWYLAMGGSIESWRSNKRRWHYSTFLWYVAMGGSIESWRYGFGLVARVK